MTGGIPQFTFQLSTTVLGTIGTVMGMNEYTRKEVEQTYRARERHLNEKLDSIENRVQNLRILETNQKIIFEQQNKIHREDLDKYFNEKMDNLNKRSRWFY